MVRLRFLNGRIATAFSACLLLSACVSHVQDADTMEVWDFLKDEEEMKADAIEGSLSCRVECIRCLTQGKQRPCSSGCDDGEALSSAFAEPELSFKAQCVISNETPYKIDLTYRYLDVWFSERMFYANGEAGEAVRMETFEAGCIFAPMETWGFFTLEPMGVCKVDAYFSVRDRAGLCKRLKDVKWQMVDASDRRMPVWVWEGNQVPDHSFCDQDFGFDVTFQKVLPLEEMGAFPRKWLDPRTGVTWTYTVFRNEVSLGSGYHDVCAVPERTSGELSIPDEIEGLPVARIGPFAFCCCDRLCVVNVPHSVRSIGHRAFSGCDKLKTINISSNLIDIAENAFEGCPDLVVRRY